MLIKNGQSQMQNAATKYALENKYVLALWQYISEGTAKTKEKGRAIALWGYAK
jgi:hypothetical protein